MRIQDWSTYEMAEEGSVAVDLHPAEDAEKVVHIPLAEREQYLALYQQKVNALVPVDDVTVRSIGEFGPHHRRARRPLPAARDPDGSGRGHHDQVEVIRDGMTARRSRGRAGSRRSAAIAEVAWPPRRRLVFFFDLDDTLHDASHAIFRQIDTRMTDYVERHLDVDRGEANRLRTLYWHRYGATLLGLVRHHAVDAAHFLRETHDFDVAALVRAERGLTRLFARLPGRKVLPTNAPMAYASEVLRALAVSSLGRVSSFPDGREYHVGSSGSSSPLQP